MGEGSLWAYRPATNQMGHVFDCFHTRPTVILEGFLHFYHYNELHSSDYHYYDATYIYTIREKFDLQIYHI